MNYGRIFRTFLIASATSISALTLLLGPAMAATERVGIAAAVNPATTGSPPGKEDRVIVVGDKMLQNERVVTSDKGRTQLLFLDGSALTIGPNSSVVLDEFVYDPKTKVGKLAFSATKGLFRLVGGKISKKTPVTFKTPSALIGIRGGIAIVTVRREGKQAALGGGLSAGQEGPSGPSTGVLRVAQTPPTGNVVTTAQLAFGQMTVQSGGVTRAVNIPGFQIVTTSASAAPSRPTRAVSPGANLAGLEGSGGDSTGGAPKPPTNEDVADSQISTMGSSIQPNAIVSAPPVGQAPPPPPPGGSITGENKVQAIVKNAINAQQNNTLDQIAGTDGGMRRNRTTRIIEKVDDGTTTSQTVTAVVDTSTLIGGGRFLRQTPFTGFDFDTAQTTRVAARNLTGSGARLDGNVLSVTSGFGDFTFDLPTSSGTFSFGSAETSIGTVSGNGYASPDKSFFYYNLRESGAGSNPASVFVGTPFTGTFPTSGIQSHDLFAGFPGKTLIPMLPQDYGGNFTGAPDPILYSAFSSNLTKISNDERSVAIYGSIAIEGVGTAQKSSQIVYIGTYFSDSASQDKVVLSGYSRGSVRLTSSGTPIRVDGAGGTTSRDGDNNSFFGTSGPDHFVISSDYTESGGSTPVSAAGFVQTLETISTPATTFFQETYTRPVALSSGIGDSRTSQTLNGFMSGVGSDRNNAGSVASYLVRTLSEDPSNFEIVTNASTNRLYATVKTEDATGAREALVIPLGNPSGVGRSRQAFIDDSIFGVRESSSSSPTFSATAATGRMAMITSAFTSLSSSLTSGVSFCTCTHTKWGFISGEVRKDGTGDRHRFHLVPWVAGRFSGSAVTSVLTGSATHTGHVVANVQNGSQTYIAFGNYSQTWSFSSRSGTATISDLDGTTYTGTITGVSTTGGSRFDGTISGTGRAGNIAGAFMKGSGNSAEEVGVQFHVTGTSYDAAGVGLGKAP
jgi:trimeric autotransporter adhesin